jgi:hypothetical protein
LSAALSLPDSTAEWPGVTASGVLASFTVALAFPWPMLLLLIPLSTDILSSKSVSTVYDGFMGVVMGVMGVVS